MDLLMGRYGRRKGDSPFQGLVPMVATGASGGRQEEQTSHGPGQAVCISQHLEAVFGHKHLR